MDAIGAIREWLPERLAELARRHRVPGATVAVLAGDEIAEAAYGVLSRATGVPVTTDSLFQIGSITKVWTASLIMQLVDEGLLDLDAPVRRYLPEFRVADEGASAQVTVRQLTCHTAGFEGDIFTDTGRGDDAIERYLATLDDVPQLFPPGQRHSYNNAGYVVLGRLVEVLRRKPYAVALRDHLIDPLGLRHAATDAYEAILHRVAVGHVAREPDGDPQPSRVWSLVASNAPAASHLCMSAAELVAFAKLHLDGGGAVLTSSAVKAMQQRQVGLPDLGRPGEAWGIGWKVFDWDDGFVVGHDGTTVGQAAFLRMVPGAGVAVAVLANGGDAASVFRGVAERVLAELTGVRMPQPPRPPPTPERVDPHRYAGRYEARVIVYEVVAQDGRLWLSATPRGTFAELGRLPERYEIVRLAGDTFVTTEPKGGAHAPFAFLGADADGRARFLFYSRAVPRVAD